MSFFYLTIVYFLITDPIGNLSAFGRVLSGVPAERRRGVLVRELLYALGLMLLCSLLGEWIMNALSISEVTVRLSAGIVLFLVALGILFPSERSARNLVHPEENPHFVPLAVPLLAGPSLIAMIILFAHLDDTLWRPLFAITVAWGFSAAILLSGNFLRRILGEHGAMGIERLLGMVLILLATQQVMEGVKLFVETYPEFYQKQLL